jgi:hypothetical protein
MIDKSAKCKQLDYKEEMVQDADEEGESLWSASKDDSLSDKGKY